MGWIEEVHPAKLMYDDRYAEWRESQRSTARYLPQVAREGEEDEPDVLVQVARIKERRRQRRAAMLPPTGSSAWAMPLADDKVTFVNEPLISDDQDVSGVKDSPYMQADREWENLPETPETAKKKEPINWQELEDETLWYEVAELYGLGEMGVYDPERLAELFELHKKVLCYARMLEEVKDFMDNWVKHGMPVTQSSDLRRYLMKIGRMHAVVNTQDPSLVEGVAEKAVLEDLWLQRGKMLVAAAWWSFRDAVEEAIRIGKQPSLVHIGHIGWLGADALNWPWTEGYTLDARLVREERPETVMGVMIHEPLHDRGKLFLGHSAVWTWKEVDESIGWNVQGNWGEGIEKLMLYAMNIMMRTSSRSTGDQKRAKNQWESSLRKSGLNMR